ncbi:hypothetical protein GGC47_004950 [Bosea sp. OAE752]|uniref:hypothetical protein n=2 Tax=unclassified Bosea (in: a-proteobacteria) TaxID=2653178 RepID=UPI003D20DC2C
MSVKRSPGATGRRPHFELKSREAAAAEASRKSIQRERRDRENADRKMERAATLDVNVRGAPPGMSTSTSMSGMFKDIRLRQVVKPPRPGVDVWLQQAALVDLPLFAKVQALRPLGVFGCKRIAGDKRRSF